jgi:putative drug exporter of the RND superfamily
MKVQVLDMQKLARWSFRHRWVVVGLWLVALAGFRMLDLAVGSDYSHDFEPPHTDSAQVQSWLEAAAPEQAGDTDRIVYAVASGSLSDPQLQQRIKSSVDAVAELPHVTSVVSPLSPQGREQVSTNGRIAYATVQFDDLAENLPVDAIHRVVDTARATAGDGLQVELGGEAISKAAEPSVGGVGIGILAAAIVLFLAFGSLVATGLPLVIAILSLGTSLAIVDVLSHVVSIADFTPDLATLLGLGVGIDYAMFIVSRHRSGLLAGRSLVDSAVSAVNTAGRAVLFAGITVCIALLGMFTLGMKVFYGVGLGASVAVIVTVLAALTLQPALLSLFGHRVLSRRQRRTIGVAAMSGSPLWAAWTTRLRRSPGTLVASGMLIIIGLAIPALSLRLGYSDAGNEPTANTSRRAYDLLADGFGPGFNGPFTLVTPDAKNRDAFAGVLHQLSATPGVAGVSAPVTVGSGDQSILVAQLIPDTAPQASATSDLLRHLRKDVIPAETPLDVRIGGVTAVNEDFSRAIARHLALFIGVVIGFSCLLLALMFRSLVIPILAAVMNLLSVAASLGVVTAVFEKGWLNEVFGSHSTGPIEPFIPVLIFSVLFGLSMDYEVFLVARMHEIWLKSKDNTVAITRGLAHTGRIITAAAAIMIFVFGAFMLSDNRLLKIFGLGLGSAVLIDALIIRTLVLPAKMLLLGRLNWAMPSSLERFLPRLNLEGAEATVSRSSELDPVS